VQINLVTMGVCVSMTAFTERRAGDDANARLAVLVCARNAPLFTSCTAASSRAAPADSQSETVHATAVLLMRFDGFWNE
jgi:hypothetical protein